MSDDFEFTENWNGIQSGVDFYHIWNLILDTIETPRKILEIGVFEGRSTCKFIEMFGASSDISVTCIDVWSGPVPHDRRSDAVHEARFDHNVARQIALTPHAVTLRKIKQDSGLALPMLIHQGESETFDWIYVDGSHRSEDVLFDATLAFRLLKSGGVMVFDDYLWNTPDGGTILDTPKAAIDAFVNINYHRLDVYRGTGLYQLYINKR